MQTTASPRHAGGGRAERSIFSAERASINCVNLRKNILPTRGRAHLILNKGPDHRVRRVLMRRR